MMRARRVLPILLAALIGGGVFAADPAFAKKKVFTSDFDVTSCAFSTTGRNPYFVLDPGFRLNLEGVQEKELQELQITVLPDTEMVDVPGLGPVLTRVVEEREWADGALTEVSRNFYAICDRTNSVFYFGEDVDIYENGQVVSHDGAWRSGENGALPGVFMPGTFLLGARYYQEIAPGVALDRAEHVRMGLSVDVPFGHFDDVVRIRESSGLESGREYKLYAPGVGVIMDENLELVDVFDPGP